MFSGSSFLNQGLVLGALIGIFLLAPMMGTTMLAAAIPAALIGGVIEKIRLDQQATAANPGAHPPARHFRLPFVSHVPKLDLQKELLPEIAQNSRHQLHPDKGEERGGHHGSFVERLAEERPGPLQR